MEREKTLFKIKLFRTIAKLGFTKILSISHKEVDETILMYNEYDNKDIMANLAVTFVNLDDDSDGVIIKINISNMATAFT
jgi:hypothetical protein